MYWMGLVPLTWNAVLVTVLGLVVVRQSLRDLRIDGNMAHSTQQLRESTQQECSYIRVCWVKRTVAKSNVWLQKAQMCTFHTTHNHSHIEEQIKECFTTGMLCMELVTTTTPHPSHHSLRKSLLLTLNWCWKPVSVQSGGVLSSLFTLILMLGARILVSPHTMSSWMASWIKIYWSYKREGINTLMIS